MPASRTSPLDALAEELGLVAGRIEREASLRVDAAISDLRRVDAERELRLTNLERAIADRLASVTNGKDGAPGRDGIDGQPGEPGAAGRDGVDGNPGADGAPGRDGIDGKDGAPGVAGRDGVDGAPGERGVDGAPGRDGANGIDGKDGAPGRLPTAKQWADGVHYAGVVVTHHGSTYQARSDTGREPPHEDWICLAASGRDGKDGRAPRVRETYSADVADYRDLDIVALGGAAFIARRDNPGACPGDGWQLIASQGKRGNQGERGGVGPRGSAGPAIIRMSANDDGLLTIINADGSTVECDLYPLLAKSSHVR